MALPNIPAGATGLKLQIFFKKEDGSAFDVTSASVVMKVDGQADRVFTVVDGPNGKTEHAVAAGFPVGQFMGSVEVTLTGGTLLKSTIYFEAT